MTISNVISNSRKAALIGLSAGLLLATLVLTTCGPPAPARIEPVGEQTNITFVALSLDVGYYEALAQNFNTEHPTIHVQVRDADDFFSPGDELPPAEVVCRLASSTDVFLSYELDPATLSATGAVHDLQPLLNSHPEFATDDFFPGLLERFERDDGLWGIPAGVDPLMMFYNKSLFNAAGVDYPQSGWDWDDFLSNALALTDPDAGIWGFTGQWGYGSLGAFIYQHGGTLVTSDGPDFDNPLAAEALAWYADLSRMHHVMPGPDSLDAPRPEGNKLPQTSRAALWIGGLGQNRSTHTDVVPLPHDRQDAAMADVSAYYVSASTAHPQAAWQWIDFLSRRSAAPELLPARRSVFGSSVYRSEVDDAAYAAYGYILEHLSGSPWPAHYPWFAAAYYWLVEEGLPAVMRGERDPKDVLSEAQSHAVAALSESPGAACTGPVVVAQPTAASPDTVNLTFLTFTNVDAYKDLARLYEREHPGVAVDVTDFASGVDYSPKWLADETDVFLTSTRFPLSSVEDHWLDLQPLIESDPTVALDDFYSQGLEVYRRQGDLWGLPAEIDAVMLFYNKSLFDAAGVPYPQAGWTWDDFLATADQLTQGESAEKQWGFITLTDGWAKYSLILAAQQGGCLVDNRTAPTAPTLDDPAVVDAVRWYADLSQVYNIMPPPATHYADWQAMEALVSQERAAMWLASTGSRYWTHMDIDLSVVPLPVLSGEGQPATMYASIGYGISAQTRHPQEAWHWLTFVTRQSGAMRCLPARRSLADQATFPLAPSKLRSEIQRAYQLTLESYADASYDIVWAQAPWFNAIYKLYRHAVKQILEEGTAPAETLGSAQIVAEAYMACLETHGGLTTEGVGAACEEETGVPASVVWYEE